MAKFQIWFEECSFYRVEVEAEDREAAHDLAGEMIDNGTYDDGPVDNIEVDYSDVEELSPASSSGESQ